MDKIREKKQSFFKRQGQGSFVGFKKRKRRRGSYEKDDDFASDSNEDSDNHSLNPMKIRRRDIHDPYHVCDEYTDNSEEED